MSAPANHRAVISLSLKMGPEWARYKEKVLEGRKPGRKDIYAFVQLVCAKINAEGHYYGNSVLNREILSSLKKAGVPVEFLIGVKPFAWNTKGDLSSVKWKKVKKMIADRDKVFVAIAPKKKKKGGKKKKKKKKSLKLNF